MTVVNLAVEGATDRAVVAKVLVEAGVQIGTIYGLKGKAHLDSSLRGFNHSAKYRPWVVVRDLDQDADCPGELVAALLPEPAKWMRLRIASRAVESWLLADGEMIADFLAIERGRVPTNPDALDDPKMALVTLARRSRRTSVIEQLVPRPGSARKVGPAYPATVAEFAASRWRPDVARKHSSSLQRCIERVKELGKFRA